MGVCNCSLVCCMLLCERSSIAIVLIGKRELVALLIFSSWCLAMVGRLFLAMTWGCLQFVIVVFPNHTHYFRAAHDPHCFQMTEVTNIHNFEKLKLLLSEL